MLRKKCFTIVVKKKFRRNQRRYVFLTRVKRGKNCFFDEKEMCE